MLGVAAAGVGGTDGGAFGSAGLAAESLSFILGLIASSAGCDAIAEVKGCVNVVSCDNDEDVWWVGSCLCGKSDCQAGLVKSVSRNLHVKGPWSFPHLKPSHP